MIREVVFGLAVGLGVVSLETKHQSPEDAILQTLSSCAPVAKTWQPAVNSSWQIVLGNPISLPSSAKSVTPDVEIFDIDMFTNSNSTIGTLHRLGKKVVCYFSAGSYEPGRPDSSQFHKADLGKELDGWPGEYWLNLSSTNVRNIMAKRIQLAAEKGCDAVDPDNVDGYNNDNGLHLTQNDSISFLNFLSTAATSHNLSMGLKNAGDLIATVLPLVHFSVNEQCVEYSECTTFAPFIKAGKPVFHIEYPKDAPGKLSNSTVQKYCADQGAGEGTDGFSTVLKDMDLDGWVEYCSGEVASTPLDTN
ncbi:MAG: hypothetical protein M1821_008115 [Bathelium mastoideum]|nr:MAG: hypothetical protein M1821_008115 [Bathelium mastoideum]